MANEIPSPQSVVVPVCDLLFYKLKDLITEQSEGEWTDEMVVKDAHHFANHLRPLLAAAPAPSSLAGGEVKEAVARIEAGLERAEEIGTERVLFGRRGPGIVLEDLRAILAALSPEAPDSGVVSDAIAAKYKQVKATTYTPGTPAERMKDGRLRGLNDALAIALIEEERAALTPRHEAPASEGEAVAFRDVFLSWHEECGTVERAGYGASPIGKFQSRWPGFHKKLWDAAMTSHDALRDAWVKVAKECEK